MMVVEGQGGWRLEGASAPPFISGAGWFVWRCKQFASLTAIRSFCPDHCQPPLVLQRSTSTAFGKTISSSGGIMVLTADTLQVAL